MQEDQDKKLVSALKFIIGVELLNMDHVKRWKPEFIGSNWQNELIIYIIDNSQQIKYIELNTFVTESDNWALQADYLVYFSVRYHFYF